MSNIPKNIKNNNRATSQKSSSVVINSATIDAKNPIPFQGNSTTFSQEGKEYIPFLNPDDTYFQTLLEAKLLSTTTMQCINSKLDYIVGGGLYSKIGEIKDTEFLDFLNSVNNKGESLDEVCRIAEDDKLTVGNAFIEIVKKKIGSTVVIMPYNRSFLECRLKKSTDGIRSEAIIISKEFLNSGTFNFDNSKALEIPIYDPKNKNFKWYKNTEAGTEHCIIHLKNTTSGSPWYGMPSNVSCLPQQILEYKSARYNIDNFENNLSIGGLIILAGQLTETEADKVGKNIIKAHSGDGKRGRYVVISSEQGIEKSNIIPFDKQKDGDYIQFDKHNEEKLFTGNKWSKSLIDPQLSGLGNSGKQIREIFQMKNKTVIAPEQKYLIDKFIKPFLDLVSKETKKEWNKFELAFKTVSPLSFSGDIDINAVLTKNEGRVEIGMEEKDGDFWEEPISKPKNDTKNVPN